MKRLLPLLARTTPLMLRKLALPTFFTVNMLFYNALGSTKCITDSVVLSETISSIERNVIRIESNGDLVGQAFCFAQNYLVSASYNLQDVNKRLPGRNYEFYLGETKLQGTFRVVGQFQNLTFFQHDSNVTIEPLLCDNANGNHLISPVQIFMKREYPSIKNGYFVAKDSGYGIIDGRGEIGGLVIKNGRAAGIVTQIGRDLESGFLRFIQWKHLPRILDYLKGKNKVHLGISAQAQAFKQGVSVVRIAPNSPLKDQMLMGDRIVKANNQRIRDVEALQRICILSDGYLTLEIIRDDAPLEIKASIFG